MTQSKHFFSLFDKNGNLYAAVLSAEFWKRFRHRLEPQLRAMLEEMEPTQRVEPLHEWEELKRYWDFKYPFNAEVECGNCGATTRDWKHDPAKPFRLKGANLGGLAVFACNACGATIRKKHFKDHCCYEFSVGGCGES